MLAVRPMVPEGNFKIFLSALLAFKAMGSKVRVSYCLRSDGYGLVTTPGGYLENE